MLTFGENMYFRGTVSLRPPAWSAAVAEPKRSDERRNSANFRQAVVVESLAALMLETTRLVGSHRSVHRVLVEEVDRSLHIVQQ